MDIKTMQRLKREAEAAIKARVEAFGAAGRAAVKLPVDRQGAGV